MLSQTGLLVSEGLLLYTLHEGGFGQTRLLSAAASNQDCWVLGAWTSGYVILALIVSIRRRSRRLERSLTCAARNTRKVDTTTPAPTCLPAQFQGSTSSTTCEHLLHLRNSNSVIIFFCSSHSDTFHRILSLVKPDPVSSLRNALHEEPWSRPQTYTASRLLKVLLQARIT